MIHTSEIEPSEKPSIESSRRGRLANTLLRQYELHSIIRFHVILPIPGDH